MAKSISEEELQLKKRARRRLIGAIALVTMVIVFLPMVLDHEPRPVSQDINIQIPSPNSATYTSKIVPVVPGAPNPGGKTIVIPPEPEAPAKAEARTQAPPNYDTEAAPAPPKKATAEKAVSEKAQPVAPPVAVAAVKPVEPSATPAKSAPPPAPAEAKATSGFVVQVAALTDAGKAKEMQDKMSASGMKAYTEVVPTAKGSVTRVRAGPFATREEAEKMRDKLKDMGLAGNIVPK